MGTVEEIGDDCVAAILLLLDLKSLIRAVSSCKRWRRVVYKDHTFISEYRASHHSVQCLCTYVDAGNGFFRPLGCAFAAGSTQFVDMGDVLPQLVASHNIITDTWCSGGHVFHRRTLDLGATHFTDLWKPKTAAVHVESYKMCERGWKLEVDTPFPVALGNWDMYIGCDWTPAPGDDPTLYKISNGKLLVHNGKWQQEVDLTVQLSLGSAYVVTGELVLYCMGTSQAIGALVEPVCQMVKVDMRSLERKVTQVDIRLDDGLLFMFDLGGDVMLVKLYGGGGSPMLEAYMWHDCSMKWCVKLPFTYDSPGYITDALAASETQFILRTNAQVLYVLDSDRKELIEVRGANGLLGHFMVDLLSLFDARISKAKMY